MFQQYVTESLESRLVFASVQYPQGNGINESAHRILETAIKTRTPEPALSIQDIVAEAVLLYNVTPNRTIGDTPSSLLFGMDLAIPGLAEWELAVQEGSRLQAIRDRRGFQLVVKQVRDDLQQETPSNSASSPEFCIGDIVTYALSKDEKKKAMHYSLEPQYSPERSFPQRVVKVSEGSIVMTPLWTRGPERSAPKVQCRRITSFIPEELRKRVQLLYPRVPWTVIPSTSPSSSSSSAFVRPEAGITSSDPKGSAQESLAKSPRKRSRKDVRESAADATEGQNTARTMEGCVVSGRRVSFIPPLGRALPVVTSQPSPRPGPAGSA